MLLDYINNNYKNGEPILLEEIDYKNKDALRQEMKRLTDEGILVRAFNGVYYKAYKTIFNTKGKMSIEKYIDKKYLNESSSKIGYITGLSLANKYGFTTQVPAQIEITSNKATTKQRKVEVDGHILIIYSPVVEINEENISSLQFLDLMQNIDKYSELDGEELKNKLKEYVAKTNVDFNIAKNIINLYPDRVYKNIYNVGLMNELV